VTNFSEIEIELLRNEEVFRSNKTKNKLKQHKSNPIEKISAQNLRYLSLSERSADNETNSKERENKDHYKYIIDNQQQVKLINDSKAKPNNNATQNMMNLMYDIFESIPELTRLQTW